MKIEEYKNKFPFGLEEFTGALSNKERLAIASLLYEKEPLSYEEIIKYLDTKDENQIIKINLDAMNRYGVVARTNNKFTGEIFVSDFKLNKIYRELMECCIRKLSTGRSMPII